MQKVKPNPGGRCGDLRRDPQMWLYGEPSPSPSVVAASSQNGEEHEDDDEHPQQRTHGDASHQRQDDENDKQNDDQIHAYDSNARITARSSVATTEEVAGNPVGSEGSGWLTSASYVLSQFATITRRELSWDIGTHNRAVATADFEGWCSTR